MYIINQFKSVRKGAGNLLFIKILLWCLSLLICFRNGLKHANLHLIFKSTKQSGIFFANSAFINRFRLIILTTPITPNSPIENH